MSNEHGRASGDGSILDSRLLRLMREQERKVEQVIADAKQRQRPQNQSAVGSNAFCPDVHLVCPTCMPTWGAQRARSEVAERAACTRLPRQRCRVRTPPL